MTMHEMKNLKMSWVIPKTYPWEACECMPRGHHSDGYTI